jgi:hypothetical protein
MPPLSSCNRFTCLEVDTPIEPLICITNSTEVVQTPSHPPIPNRRSRLPAWEHRLPVKYVVAASPGPISLMMDVEISQLIPWSSDAHRPSLTAVLLAASLTLSG